MIASWAAKYIGLDFADASMGPTKFDCWGLLAWIYRHEFNIDLKAEMTYSTKQEKVDEFLRKRIHWNKVEDPEIGDAVLFLTNGTVPHCGIYIGEGKMIHTFYGAMSCIQDIFCLKWKSRFDGYYRYSPGTG